MNTRYLSVDLFKEMGIDSLPENQKKELMDQLEKTVNSRIEMALFSALSEKDQEELGELPATQDVGEFLRARIPFMDAMILEVVGQFKGEMIGLKDAVLNTLNSDQK